MVKKPSIATLFCFFSGRVQCLLLQILHYVDAFLCSFTERVVCQVFTRDSIPIGWQDKQEGKQRGRQPVRQPVECERFALCSSSSTTSQSGVSTQTTGAVSPALLPKGTGIIGPIWSASTLCTVLPNQPPKHGVSLPVCHQRALSTNKDFFIVSLEYKYILV